VQTAAITQRLAQFLAQSQWKDISAEVRHEAKRSVMNFMGTALGGCRDDAVTAGLQASPPSSARHRRR
jgi:2-methylcitrate dehydratase PrpD